MRTLLCFGDSNTYGQIPGQGPLDRFEWSVRWPGVLNEALGSAWYVIEEGLSGRTTVSDDPIEGIWKNGRTYLLPCYQSHAPLDLIIIMLGTNDLKVRFRKPASEVAMGMGVIVNDIKQFASQSDEEHRPEIMIVSPPPMLDDLKEWQPVFAEGQARSRELALEFEQIADALEVHFFDAGTVASCSDVDGFHIGADAHKALGEALAREIRLIGWDDEKSD